MKVQHLPLSELADLCRERRQAAVTSGYPKTIKELRIFPLNEWLKPESRSQVSREVKGSLMNCKTRLGEGCSFGDLSSGKHVPTDGCRSHQSHHNDNKFFEVLECHE
ncbi:hypothetical protein M407DRAFT_174394 [Tulasnella calospora MUT 4182]|uniref:Uncharacterized protein n=1 Tax=Tulasnella calospora MUT 4182 TaxID=1051891 RepID=A0A0C3QP02_9AGAM|nr:hypothetical protein M407DRAFT_174394 [Tulasnella calospora MUT 4182]